MPRIRYQVAMSLDGYIAGPNGEIDWITADPDIDFGALLAQFDTFLMGRRTFEVVRAMGSPASGETTFVFSRTLQPQDYPDVTIVGDVSTDTVAPIRTQAAKDIWLFGGGELFRGFVETGLVDTVEVAVMPVLLGGGLPLYSHTTRHVELHLTSHTAYGSGIVMLEYDVRKTGRER